MRFVLRSSTYASAVCEPELPASTETTSRALKLNLLVGSSTETDHAPAKVGSQADCAIKRTTAKVTDATTSFCFKDFMPFDFHFPAMLFAWRIIHSVSLAARMDFNPALGT